MQDTALRRIFPLAALASVAALGLAACGSDRPRPPPRPG